MKSFKTFLTEGYAGNYVCIEAEDLSSFFKDLNLPEPKSGTIPPDFHCTLIYSERSVIEPERISSVMRSSGFDKKYVANINGFKLFDCPEDSEKVSLVATLDSPELLQLHDFLKGMGLLHSYKEFMPHITLRYAMDSAEAAKYKELLNGKTMSVTMANFRSETINKNYV